MGSRVVSVKRLDHARDLPLPSYQTSGSSGLDLYAAVKEQTTILPGHRLLVPTGISIELPSDCEAQIRPRSGLAMKHGVTVLNSPGTIDSDYRGEIAVLLINLGQCSVCINRGDRIAQMIIGSVCRIALQEVIELSTTQRGHKGFGHTGQ